MFLVIYSQQNAFVSSVSGMYHVLILTRVVKINGIITITNSVDHGILDTNKINNVQGNVFVL